MSTINDNFQFWDKHLTVIFCSGHMITNNNVESEGSK